MKGMRINMEDDKRSRRRLRRYDRDGIGFKKALFIAGTILALGIIAFVITVIIYNNSLEKVYDSLEIKGLEEVGSIEERVKPSEAVSSSIRKNYRGSKKRD